MKDHGKSLEADVIGDTSGDFRDILVALLNSKQLEASINETQIKEVFLKNYLRNYSVDVQFSSIF